MTSDILLPILDGVVLVALGVTGFFLLRLMRQVRILRQGRAEMQQHVTQLGDAAHRAEVALATLRHMADDTGRHLENQILDAKELLEELRFMAEASDRIAGRLEKHSTKARQALEDMREEHIPQQPPATTAMPEHGVVAQEKPVASSEKHSVADMEARIRARAQGYLEKLSAGLAATKAPKTDMALENDPAMRGLKSQAERELMRAMQMRRVS